MHMHTIQLSTMRCVCIISVLFVFEKILMFCKSYPHNRSIVFLCVCLNSLILWSTALYSSMAAVSSSLLFYCSLPPPVLLSHRLTSVFISCLLSPFPVPSVGVCVRVMLCVSDSTDQTRPNTLDCFCSPHWLSSTLNTHTYFRLA